MYTKIVITILIACFALGIFWLVNKKLATLKASKIVADVYAVWAAQGPFENGEASAKAMRNATLAVRGMDSLDDKKYKEAISQHESAYDADPARWEALRKKSLPISKSDTFEKQLEIAKNIASNEIALSKFGEKLISDTSKEAKNLMSFLRAAYKSRYEKDLEKSMDIGFIYAQIYSESFKYPDQEFYRKFLKLIERWKGSISGDN